jgi:hypothetical protein
VTLKNIVCNADVKFVSDIQCRIFAGNRTFKRLTISGNVLQDQNNILVSFSSVYVCESEKKKEEFGRISNFI